MFRLILHEMLATTPGAVAVVFLDWEGETVELVCDRDLSDHDLRTLGAWQGIFLTRLREICTRLEAGQPHRFKMEFERQAVFSRDIQDGYYVVMLLEITFNEGLAWRRIEKCREQLLAEM